MAVPERVNHFIADTHPTLVHRISELLLTCLRPTSHRRVFTRRQPVDRVRPVDVWFQVNVHRVSVLAVMRLLGIFICLVSVFLGAFAGFAIAGFSDGGRSYARIGGVLGFIAGMVFNRLTGITPKQTK